MPIPFDMIAVMLFLGYYSETPRTAPASPGMGFALLALFCAVVFVVSTGINKALTSRIRRRSGVGRRRLIGLADILIRIVLMSSYMGVLTVSDLPWSLMRFFGLAADSETFALQFFGLLPYLPLFVSAWFPMFGFHRETVPGKWTRPAFLLNKARYNLFMLLAWLPFALLAEWLSDFLLALPVLFLAVTWSFPFLLAWAWGCKRLPDGEVMDMVRRLEAGTGAKFSRVYLWEPGGGSVQNAAAVGVFPPFRYLFLTPALIRCMPRPELEAVILHELGHVKRKHLLFYLFTSLASINLAAMAGLFLPLDGPGERFVVTAVLVLVYFRFMFGWLSRNMERQADLFALEKTDNARGLVNALEKLGISAGNIRAASSWHHMGIAERVDFLRHAERDRSLMYAHNRKVRGIMTAGYLFSLGMIAMLGWLVHVQFALPDAPAPGGAPEQVDEAHWRRVMALMPTHPTPLLELAYRLAGDPESHREAADLADRAWRFAANGEERAAAARLKKDLGTRDGVGPHIP